MTWFVDKVADWMFGMFSTLPSQWTTFWWWVFLLGVGTACLGPWLGLPRWAGWVAAATPWIVTQIVRRR